MGKQLADSNGKGTDELCWVDVDDGYALALDHKGKLVARNPKGKKLASVPKKIKNTSNQKRK